MSKPDRRTELRQKLDGTLETMRRAATAAVLKGDPLAEQMTALALAVEALGEISDASAKTHLEIEQNLRNQAAMIADGAIERVDAAGLGILNQLTPRLLTLVERSSRQRFATWRLRSIIATTAAALIALAVSGGTVYAIGYTAGRTNGELVGRTISAAMAGGPEAAADWAGLMVANDPRKGLATCRQSIATDEYGRRYCQMPVWLDPPSAARASS